MKFFKALGKRGLLQFMVLAFGGNAIFYVLYCRASFYDAFVNVLSVSNEQFGILFAVYGWIATVGYFVGGIVADKVPTRLLMFLSYTGTGICNVIFGFFPSYTVCLILYACMGITTTVTFWSALLKATRTFGQQIGSESKAFGFLETGRGIFGIVFATLIVFLYNQIAQPDLGDVGRMKIGLRFVIWTYGFLLILFGVAALFVFDKGTGEKEVSSENPLKLVWKCITNVDVWLMVLMAMGGYNIGSCFGSYMGDMSGIFGASASMMAYIGLIPEYFKPIGAFGAGFIGEKKGPSFVVNYSNLIYLVIMLPILLLLPKNKSFLAVFLIIMVFEVVLTGAFRSHKFATVREGRIPMELSGTVIGFISTIIYSQDAIMPVFIGRWLDRYDEVTAYTRLFYVLVGSGIVTLAAYLIFRARNKANIKLTLEEEAAKRRELAAGK